ncbi:MAG TPA: guanylate kinase [Edaphobacter sp.]
MAGILFIISAPSGSGKSTLVSQLRTLVEGLDFSISYTTRPPRGSEENGREYYFTTREEFERMIAAGEFLEWAKVFGNYYGTAVSVLRHAKELGKDLLLDIDVQGALQVMEKMPDAVSIFILPPSPQVLEMRLRNRSKAEKMDSEAVIEKRLNGAKDELKKVFDYEYALVNDVLEKAVAEMRAIVLYERGCGEDVKDLALQCRTDAHTPALEAVLEAFNGAVR